VDLGAYSNVNGDVSSGLQVIHEGFIGLWFLRFISSQYVVKEVVHYGGRFLSVVDCGWVEASSGQGAVRLRAASRSSLLRLNANVVPALIMVGLLVFFAIFRA